MSFRLSVILLICFLFLHHSANSQVLPEEADSTNFYTNIENYSKRSKFAKFIYRLIFRPAAIVLPVKVAPPKTYKKLKKGTNKLFEGKIIRNIEIETLDPFGYSVKDTLHKEPRTFARAGNKLHIKSQHITIRNLLLIKRNQPFDSLLVKESERLVRSSSFVNDVAFTTTMVPGSKDSVDIMIREQDKWSIAGNADLSTSKARFKLRENNFLGFGHEFRNTYTWLYTTGTDAYSSDYNIPSIRNSFIGASLHYSVGENKDYSKAISINRPFFSPFAKWGAGLYLSRQFRISSLQSSDSIFFRQDYKNDVQDYWAGYSIRMFKGNTENDRSTNFITAARYFKIHYISKPAYEFDSASYYADEKFYLLGLGISVRKYVQDKYIFKYGVTEDIPLGRVYAITGGYQIRNGIERTYFGVRVRSGNYYEWGYLSTSIQYETFYRNSYKEQENITAGIIYFTGLFELGRWRFRQFVRPEITIGLHRLSYEKLTINDGYGIDGFNSESLTGTARALVKFQTQSYAPWNLIGFRFGPYLVFSMAMLGDEQSGFNRSKIYSQLGFGVLIKNDNLVFNTFQISIAFYPLIPDDGYNIFKINSVKTTDFTFRDFETGRPDVMGFQ